jgi:hypothetical protein
VDATDGADLDRLVDIAKERGGGRIYAGLRANWGARYLVGSVPVHAWLANRDADAIGFTFRTIPSLSNDVEAAFDETNPAQYEMFDVRYLILPSDRPPPVQATEIASSGRHRLYEVQTSGYFQVADRAAAIEADRTNLQAATREFRDSDLASRGVYPGIAFAGDDGPPPTFAGAAAPAGAPGRVLGQSAVPEDGDFMATVVADRPAVALLKATYDPRWTATVDGVPVEPVMMAPSLVGVDVPAGRHDVRFRYQPYEHYPELIAIGLLTLIGLALAVGLRYSFGGVGTLPRWWRHGGEEVAPVPPGAVAESSDLSLRTYLARSRTALLVILATVAAMFVSAWTVPYAFSDDYAILWMITSGEPSPQFGKDILAAAASEGRPVVGLLDEIFFSAAGSVDNLRFVRLFAVVGIAALALLLHWALVRARIRPVVAGCIAVLICSLPAFQVYASWTTLFSVPWGGVLAGAASLLAVTNSRRRGLRETIGPNALLLAALLTYQPTAMVFWVFLAIAVAGARDDPARALRLTKIHLVVAGASLALWYVILKASIHFVGDDAFGGARSELARDVGGKLRVFVEGPLYRAANLFDLTPSRWFAALVVVVAAAGIGLWLGTRSSRPLVYFAIGLMLVPLSYLPNLVITDTWTPYRTQVALSSLIALYFCLGAMGFWVVGRDWLSSRLDVRKMIALERIGLGAAVIVAATGAVLALHNVRTLVAQPQKEELRLLRGQVARLPEGVQALAFVQTPWGQGLSDLVVYDEFGFASSTRPWVLGPSVNLILREQGRLASAEVPPQVAVYPPETTSPPADVPVIDLRSALASSRNSS